MKEILINENSSILEAMQQIESSAKKILFVHEEGKLLGVITDGDIRRWIIGHGDLHAPVRCAANYHPVYLHESQTNMAKYAIKKFLVDAIPIVDNDNNIVRAIFRDEYPNESLKFEQNIPVVIMAGGLGTRLLPYTSILPKPLIPIGDLPIAEHIINRFIEYGCKEYYMIVNYKRNMIKAYFDEIKKDYCLKFIVEEEPLGTGGGISLLKGKISSTFILTNCDILIEDDLTKAYKQHKKNRNKITIICSPKQFTIPYGVIEADDNERIRNIREKPQMSFLTNTGCYIVEPDVIDSLEFSKPIDFPTIIENYRKNDERVGIYTISENSWLDMGQFEELDKMKQRLGY